MTKVQLPPSQPSSVVPEFIADCCVGCEREGDRTLRGHLPRAWHPDGDGITALYECHRGHHWTCGWSLRAATEGTPL